MYPWAVTALRCGSKLFDGQEMESSNLASVTNIEWSDENQREVEAIRRGVDQISLNYFPEFNNDVTAKCT